MSDIVATYASGGVLPAGLPIPYTSAIVQTTDATTTTLLTLACPDNTVMRVWGHLVGISTAHDGSLYTARFDFLAERHGGAGVVVKDLSGTTGADAPIPAEIIKAGTTTGWLTDAAASGNNVLVRVVGHSSTTINWTIRYETVSIT
jgi:hypothetical protein